MNIKISHRGFTAAYDALVVQRLTEANSMIINCNVVRIIFCSIGKASYYLVQRLGVNIFDHSLLKNISIVIPHIFSSSHRYVNQSFPNLVLKPPPLRSTRLPVLIEPYDDQG